MMRGPVWGGPQAAGKRHSQPFRAKRLPHPRGVYQGTKPYQARIRSRRVLAEGKTVWCRELISSIRDRTHRKERGGPDPPVVIFIFKAVLTSRKHQTTRCVLQLQAASSRSTSTDWLYDYPTGYITDPARRVAVGGSLTAHKSVEPPAQPPHRCLSNAVYCWMTHVFSSFFLCAI